MAVNGISVGKDYSFGLYDATTGVLVPLGIVENVHDHGQQARHQGDALQ